MNQNRLCGEQFECSFDDQSLVDDGRLHTALTDALPFDDAVRVCQINSPAFFVCKPANCADANSRGYLTTADNVVLAQMLG